VPDLVKRLTVIYANRLFSVTGGDFSALERLGMSRAKWNHYQEQLRKLGLAGGITKSEGRVEFRVDPGSISMVAPGTSFSMLPQARAYRLILIRGRPATAAPISIDAG
jgi:hypothetical protein